MGAPPCACACLARRGTSLDATPTHSAALALAATGSSCAASDRSLPIHVRGVQGSPQASRRGLDTLMRLQACLPHDPPLRLECARVPGDLLGGGRDGTGSREVPTRKSAATRDIPMGTSGAESHAHAPGASAAPHMTSARSPCWMDMTSARPPCWLDAGHAGFLNATYAFCRCQICGNAARTQPQNRIFSLQEWHTHCHGRLEAPGGASTSKVGGWHASFRRPRGEEGG